MTISEIHKHMDHLILSIYKNILALSILNSLYYKNVYNECINSNKIINGIDIYYNTGSHSIGNILQSYIYNLIDSSILEYIGYKMVHPLKKEMLLTFGYSKNINDIHIETKKIFINLKKIFENMNIEKFIVEDEDEE